MKFRKTARRLDVGGVFFDRLILINASKREKKVKMVVQLREIAM